MARAEQLEYSSIGERLNAAFLTLAQAEVRTERLQAHAKKAQEQFQDGSMIAQDRSKMTPTGFKMAPKRARESRKTGSG